MIHLGKIGRVIFVCLVLVSIMACSTSARAGSICGVVTDAVTGNPVVSAGLFLRDPAGMYTGLYGASGADGSYCIDGVPPGTYTLEVRVDDYLVSFQSGIVVTDAISDVPIAADIPAIRLDPPWPNPSAEAVNMRLEVKRPAEVRLDIYDARGRLVRSWSVTSLDSGVHDYRWDGRTRDGRRAPAGLYMIRVRFDGNVSTRRLILAK